MKICAGIGSIDEYDRYAEAGADEIFAGYIPYEWYEKGGLFHSLNRREVLNYNVQLGSLSELEILSEQRKKRNIPVALTFNSLIYAQDQYPMILRVIEECMELGFESFIVADVVLLLYLQQLPAQKRERMKLHLSGECGEINTFMIEQMKEFDISRVIFHRKNTLQDMEDIIRKQRLQGSTLEFEAFAMNEMCQFNGSFCNSLHCDELCPSCRIPYRLEKKIEIKEKRDLDLEYLPGTSGCGLCAFWKLQKAGVEYLKLVSRGNYIEDTIKDIGVMRKAISICETSETDEDYRKKMKSEIFLQECSHNCYYT